MTHALQPIQKVWKLTMTSTPGKTSTLMRRHPDEAAIQQSREIALSTAKLKYTVPQLDFLKSTTVKVMEGDTCRGIVDHYIYLVDDTGALGADVPAAAMVVSELPEYMRSADIALETAMVMQEKMARSWGCKLHWHQFEDPVFGAIAEMAIANRQATDLFPTANYAFSEEVSTMGVSRFAFVEGKLVEWSIVVPTPPEMTDDDLTELVFTNMNAFMHGLSPA